MLISSPQYHDAYLFLHRDVLSHSARIVEPYASLGLPMSVVTVAARRHILRELVHKKAIHRVSFSFTGYMGHNRSTF